MSIAQSQALAEAEFHYYRRMHPEYFHAVDLAWPLECFTLSELVTTNLSVRTRIRSGSSAGKPGRRINAIPNCEAPAIKAVPSIGAMPIEMSWELVPLSFGFSDEAIAELQNLPVLRQKSSTHLPQQTLCLWDRYLYE